jgi:hypothetical protein
VVDPGRPAVGFISALEEMSRHLNEPVDLSGFVILTSGGITVGGTSFDLKKIEGTAVFSQVDPVERSFTGRFQQLIISWASGAGEMLYCTTTDAPFWALPGNFL